VKIRKKLAFSSRRPAYDGDNFNPRLALKLRTSRQ
jgi:hypothetical protein